MGHFSVFSWVKDLCSYQTARPTRPRSAPPAYQFTLGRFNNNVALILPQEADQRRNWNFSTEEGAEYWCRIPATGLVIDQVCWSERSGRIWTSSFLVYVYMVNCNPMKALEQGFKVHLLSPAAEPLLSRAIHKPCQFMFSLRKLFYCFSVKVYQNLALALLCDSRLFTPPLSLNVRNNYKHIRLQTTRHYYLGLGW